VIYIQRRDRIRPAHRSLSHQKLTGLVCYEAFGAATLKALSFAISDRRRSRYLISVDFRHLQHGLFAICYSVIDKNYGSEIMNYLNKGHFLHALPFFL
jgi:hypothetical protein